jgi:hypothetical protein
VKRPLEEREMFVQVEPWARLRRQSHEVWHFSIKEAISSFDTRRARATSFDAYKQVGSTPTVGAMKSDLLLTVRKHAAHEGPRSSDVYGQ